MRFKNYINRYNKKNRIYSEEELLAMTLNDLLDNEPSILAQDGDIGIPSYEELRQSPNTRWIDTYINAQGQKDGGFFGSIPEYDESFFPKKKYPPFVFNPNPPYMMSMEDGEPETEPEEERPIVLEGGVEENVYLPEEDDAQEPEPSVYIPDEEEPEERQKTPYELSDEDLTDILQSIIKSRTSSSIELEQPLFDDSFPTIHQTDTPNTPPVSLPQLQTSLNQEELEQMYEKLLEELRKMLAKYSGANIRTIFSNNSIGNNNNKVDNFNLNASPWNSPYLPKASNEDYKLKNELIRFNNEQNKNYKDAKDLMNIALIGPENVQSNPEYRRIDKNDIKRLSKNLRDKLDSKFTTIKFEPNSSLATSINSSPSLKQSINSWYKQSENEREQTIPVIINDNENLFRSINKATILNPKFENGVFTGYLYDKYDFKPDEFKDKYTTAVNTGAVALQTVGILKNYNILVPIKMDLK